MHTIGYWGLNKPPGDSHIYKFKKWCASETVDGMEEICSWKLLVTQQISFNYVNDVHVNFE